jgi:glucuronokinase
VEIVRTVTHARVGILGNPSDGFYGKTIAAAIHNFGAEVVLYEWPVIEILPAASDLAQYTSIENLAEDVGTVGYYGGGRLIKASIKRFYEWTRDHGITLRHRNFSIRYDSNIPRQVGLGGSSAIIASTMKALMQFFQVDIPKPLLANLVLSVETHELGIFGGLQDRVAQVYDTVVFMDFDRQVMESQGYGNYEVLDANLLPPMYLAYRLSLTHRDTLHNDVRARYDRGDADVIRVMGAIAQNAINGRAALLANDVEEFNRLVDLNFDLRKSIYPIAPSNQEMIDLARSLGFSSKFPGSGGAIIGLCRNRRRFVELADAFKRINCTVAELQFEPIPGL